MKIKSLYNMMWVGKAVAPAVRRKELTWSHHREVAKLDKKMQKMYLKIAIDRKLNVADLHSLINEKNTTEVEI